MPPVLYVIGYLFVALLVLFPVIYHVFKEHGGREEDAFVVAFFWPIFLPVWIIGVLVYVLITSSVKILRRIRLAAKEKYEPRWLPIETAPKGIEFRCLLAHENSVVTGYWDGTGWVNERSPSRSYFKASAWMPLPSAPSAQEDGE